MSPTRLNNLRRKIAQRTMELGIVPVWDDRGHHYKFPDSEEFRSVTSKLQVVKDEGLANWKMNRAVDYIRENIYKDPLEYVLEQAKLAPVKEFQGAGDIGSAVHAWREVWFDQWINLGFNAPPPVSDIRVEVKASCAAIMKCVQELTVEPLAVELSLADRNLQVGGMLDDLWVVGDEVWLVDLKTSNIGNKNSYYMQVAAYWGMFKKLYKIPVDKLYILHTSKTRFAEYELIELKHPKRYWQMAKSAFKLSDDLLELEEIKKPIITKI